MGWMLAGTLPGHAGDPTGAVAPRKPEIVVEQPANGELTDGVSKISFGKMRLGKRGRAVKFIIRNIGPADLTGIKLGITGSNARDFKITRLKTSTLAEAANTVFKIRFKPSAKGIKIAKLKILSNDADESPFDITLTGTGETR